MQVKLNDKYSVRTDTYNYILFEPVINKKGKYEERNMKYYGTLEQLIQGLLENEVKTSAISDLKE